MIIKMLLKFQTKESKKIYKRANLEEEEKLLYKNDYKDSQIQLNPNRQLLKIKAFLKDLFIGNLLKNLKYKLK